MGLSMWLVVAFGVVVAAAVIGISMWVAFRPDKAGFPEADEYLEAKAAGGTMPLMSAEPTGLDDSRRRASERARARVHQHAA